MINKNFNERTLELISNFIEEFDSLFGKYVSREELIKRIEENLNEVIFVEADSENWKSKAAYNGKDGIIQLPDIEDDEILKSMFFHEMIHCITRDKERNTTAFSKIWLTDAFGKIPIITNHGLTEGFTQYVTTLRNKKYAPNIDLNSYPIVTTLTTNLIELIGEEKFLDIAFNRPDDIHKEMGFEYGIWDWESDEFFAAFQTIWRHEKEIYEKKLAQNVEEYQYDEETIEAQKIVAQNFIRLLLRKPITTVEEFNVAYDKICTYIEQLGMNRDAYVFMPLLEQLENLQQLDKVPEEIQVLIKLYQAAKEKGYDRDTLAAEYVGVEKNGKKAMGFNLYSNTTGENVYLGTLEHSDDEFCEMSPCESDNMMYIPSKLEWYIQKLRKQVQHIELLNRIGTVPQDIIDKQKYDAHEVARSIARIQKKSTLLPEEVTEGIKLKPEEILSIMEKIIEGMQNFRGTLGEGVDFVDE